MLADRARHAGDVVAAVAAPTREAARAAARLVEVEYEELPAVFDPIAAVAPRRAARARAVGRARPSDAVSIDVRPIAGHATSATASASATATSPPASTQADVIVEETFRTAGAAHAPMEPHAALAEWEDGRLEVVSGTQTPFNMRADLAGAVRPRRGARSASSRRRWAARSGPRRSCALEALVAALARKAGRPGEGRARPRRGVRHAQPPPGDGPREDRRAARRHARRQGGRLLGRHRRLRRLRARRRDRRWATPASARTGSRTCGSTRCAIYTNLPPNGAYRGYGAMQSVWASERTMDLLADRARHRARSSCGA